MARIVQIHDVLNDISVLGGIYPIKQSEKGIVAEQIKQFKSYSLGLFDRGFPSSSLMYLMENQEISRNYLMRCTLTFNNEVKAFVCSGKSSKIVDFKPSAESIEALKKMVI